MTATPFSTIHLLMDQFIEEDFTILFRFFIKKRCCFGSFCVGISGGFGPNGGLGSKEVPRKFEEMLKEIYIFLHKMVK